MCGRFTQSSSRPKLSKEFKVPLAYTPKAKPAYNIAPSQPVLILREDNGTRKFEYVNWGLIPSWAKDPAIGNRMINARVETLDQKPSFRGPLRHHRCLVVADGFYEWKREGSYRQPYYIRLKSGDPFGFAGLWSHWTSSDGSEILSCTVITMEAGDLLQSIHHRMPVILRKKNRDLWINASNQNNREALSFLEPIEDKELEAYPVSTQVNSPANDSSECVKPLKTGEGSS